MENIEKKLREEAKRLLEEKRVDVLIGYEEGTLPLTATPCFLTDPEEAGKLVWNAFCTHNLAKYVHDVISQHRNNQKRVKPEDRKKKVVGVVARGCTTRSLVIHLQERQFGRDEVVIVGVPCTGYVERRKLQAVAGGEIIGGTLSGDTVTVQTAAGEKKVAINDVLADNCLTCRFNNPVISDVMIGGEAPPMNPAAEYDLSLIDI
ncbi:MAG: hypothetical protein N2Z74_07155 [Syntrophales bacterium]|nr:hypothetical protein [Syntrophales bacterium]